MEDLIPVTIITGFLGAGKTTLLNRILTDEHGQKIAVIENEFGEESIDNDLLVQSEDEEIITMNNGCICCTIRGDLAENLIRLMERKKEGKANFDRVIIETTGLADPGPVAQTFFMDEEVAQFYMVDGVITVVDAVNGPRTLDEQAPAQAQVGFADRILLSKVDLVPPSVIEDLSDRLHHMNPRAPIVECNMGNVDIKEVLDIRGFNLDSVLELDPAAPAAATIIMTMIMVITASAGIMTTIIVNAAITIIMLAMMTRLLLLYSSLTDRLTRPDSTIT